VRRRHAFFKLGSKGNICIGGSFDFLVCRLAIAARLNSPLGVLADGNGGAWVTGAFSHTSPRS
jgi:hypothetical protein